VGILMNKQLRLILFNPLAEPTVESHLSAGTEHVCRAAAMPQ
jgi:hypothetical protein